ncbi:heavy-metal-associated domain-containing protein [Streptomyces sp. Tu 3180]|uniref:heavy-metal-associated domain-containing protein n=1 Tax=Streptomyces sp. Tu 3180 TaxID=2682611 RepID=UPI0013591109|nr:heavy-metal-associated domain-containing protein [Streptomyces sp. Tu 3180]KAF3463200.1 heavy-metal-associated domain-containing protein [Streptomyces sp. Tu 3180]
MSCCTPDGSCSTNTAATEATEGTTTVYNVSGMTCGHCKATLTKEIGALDGVLAVDVDLESGQVAVTSSGEPDDVLLAKVVDEAGYELAGRAA